MAQDLRQRLQANGTIKSYAFTSEKIEAFKQAGAELLSLADQSGWAGDNEYIHTGYRKISNSLYESGRSCFYLHNETGNIYSHLFAALWMILLPVFLYPYAKENYHELNTDDWTVFGLFFLGGFVCFVLSVVYHIFTNHSAKVHHFCLRMDLFGITAVTVGCLPPGVWYTFPCAPRSTKIFWISLDLVAQIAAAVMVVFVPKFRQPKVKPLRAALFSFTAFSAFYPIIYACYRNGYWQMDVEAGATRCLLTVLTYTIAVVAYATKIPEAWKPGYFDIWGQSHQIFHIVMAVGLTVHFSAFAKAFDYTYKFKQC